MSKEALEALIAILDDNGENPLVEDRWKVNFFDNHWRTIRAALTPQPEPIEGLKQSIEIMEGHNKWRRGAEIPMCSPKDLGEAMEITIEAASRYLNMIGD